MADAIYFKTRQLGGGRIEDQSTGQWQVGVFGKNLLPARSRSFTHGSGSGQVNKWHLSQRTLATVTYDNLDLAGGLTDYKGAAITFTKIKYAYIAIISPSSTKSLRVGPQNQSNAATLHWGGTGATVYETFYTDWELYEPYTGFTVTAGTGDIFPIYNPTGSSITYTLFLMGV